MLNVVVLLLVVGGPFWLTHVLSKEVCSERSFTLPMCFQKRCVQREVFKEVCSERCVKPERTSKFVSSGEYLPTK